MIVDLAGQKAELLAERALWLPDSGLLCVADLHLGKDSFFAAFATFLPPYGTDETLDRLERLVARLRPATVIAAGDSFHDRHAVDRLPPATLARLNALVRTVPVWRWLSGNHDPATSPLVEGWRGLDWQHDTVIFRHQAESPDPFEISGHFHPKVRFRLRGHGFNLPCFVMQGGRLILPSFGQYTGGLDIDSAAFLAVAPAAGRQVYAVHNDRTFRLADRLAETRSADKPHR